MNTKAIEKFLERQIVARAMKEVQAETFTNRVGGGKRWTNKVTKPITPKMMKKPSLKELPKDHQFKPDKKKEKSPTANAVTRSS